MNGGYRFLDVADPSAMKERLDEVSLPNFVRAAEGALERSGATLADVSFLCGLHTKRSMHDELVRTLGVDPSRTVYLDDTGHMSGVDPLLALDRAARAGELAGRRPRAAPRGRHRLHLGRQRRPLGTALAGCLTPSGRPSRIRDSRLLDPKGAQIVALTPSNPEVRIQEEAERLAAAWEADERWQGIRRPYTPEQVVRLRGSLPVEHTLARIGAERLWRLLTTEDYVAALGALSGGQAVQMVKAGLRAIYLSGWQVAADANLSGQTYPDQSLYPSNSAPGARAPAEQRAAPRRPDRLVGGRRQRRLARADRRRRRGGVRRTAARVRADEVDDRGRRGGSPLRGPARVREEVRPPRRQGARARRRSSCARSSARALRPTCSACRPSSSRAPTRSARRCSRATPTRATPSS